MIEIDANAYRHLGIALVLFEHERMMMQVQIGMLRLMELRR